MWVVVEQSKNLEDQSSTILVLCRLCYSLCLCFIRHRLQSCRNQKKTELRLIEDSIKELSAKTSTKRREIGFSSTTL
ncbi:hypothetical protein NC652_019914 [Populus alba x Populus x berolinensis]|nr:hypothetical protein NC652_019914 [Populus alba x Populus x berolinensis]